MAISIACQAWQQDLAAARVAAAYDFRDCLIDLHPGAFELSDRSINDLFSRSQLVQCGKRRRARLRRRRSLCFALNPSS